MLFENRTNKKAPDALAKFRADFEGLLAHHGQKSICHFRSAGSAYGCCNVYRTDDASLGVFDRHGNNADSDFRFLFVDRITLFPRFENRRSNFLRIGRCLGSYGTGFEAREIVFNYMIGLISHQHASSGGAVGWIAASDRNAWINRALYSNAHKQHNLVAIKNCGRGRLVQGAGKAL